ncbi:MAG: oxidoreductase [Acidobacteria bacterium]|nr:MAG: oxidoreductase [Acidobacteriota bacterium]
MDNVKNFGGMTALITGASSGIGAASATAFGTRGARVLIHYNCQESEAQRILERVRGAGGQGELLRADLTTMDGVRSLVRALAGRRIDILVNNAGSLIQRTPVLNFTEELWEQVLTLNLTSAFFLAKAVLAGMVERKSGFVVNVSSVAARNGGGLGALAYASAKGALSTMTMGLAKEFAPFGIRVNAVSPGTIDTKYHRNFSNDQILNAVKAATPMARLGTAEEVADVILFLCSHEARFIQGQVIEVNGGFS